MDRVPPLVSCPDNLLFSVETGSGGVELNWADPTVSDNSGSVTLVSNSHNSGDSFAPGETTVIYIYQDPSNNRNQCSFTITVVEGISYVLLIWKKCFSN